MSLVDFEKIKIHFSGDKDLIVKLVGIFKETYPEVLKDLLNAINKKSPRDLELHAHTLKGMVANLFCEEIASKTFELERRGRSDQFKGDELALVKEISDLIIKMLAEFDSKLESKIYLKK